MANTKDVAIPDITKDDEVLRSISNLDDALAFLNEHGIAMQDVEDYGNGFHVIEKSTLVDVPFVCLGAEIKTGTYGPMAVLFVVSKDGKGIIVDGSTGIRDQLTGYDDNGRHVPGLFDQGLKAPFKVERGLTRSDYEYDDGKGARIPATTYYLSS